MSAHEVETLLTAQDPGGTTRRVEQGLLRWFYLAAMQGRYSSSPETAMNEDLKAIASGSPVQ